MKIKRQTVFNTEGDIRAWLRGVFGLRLFWLEPSAGSTFGFPDCMLTVDGGRCVFLELKLAQRKGEEIRFKVRREQRITIARMRDQGIRVLLLVAVQAEAELWLVTPDNSTLDGGKQKTDQISQKENLVKLDRFAPVPTLLAQFTGEKSSARSSRSKG